MSVVDWGKDIQEIINNIYNLYKKMFLMTRIQIFTMGDFEPS